MMLSLHFGAFVQPLKQQLRDAKVKAPAGSVSAWQQDADAITRLVIRGLLTDSAAQAARRKLLRTICKEARSYD